MARALHIERFAGRLTNTASPAGAFDYAYDPVRVLLPARVSLPNGAVINNAYDNVARLLGTTLQSSDGAVMGSHAYTYDLGGQRRSQLFARTNSVDYTYDKIGQLKTAVGKEPDASGRLHEQLAYDYDAAGNLSGRLNNALLENFAVNNLNELTTATRSGTLTVAGSVSGATTNITVNGGAGELYVDWTFARSNLALVDGTNTFTAVGRSQSGLRSTNIVAVDLPASNVFTYDANGNLVSDGKRCFAYDDENQLISVWVTNQWRSDFVYDGKMRRRVRKEYTWQTSAWSQTAEVHYVYDGNLVIQERNQTNLVLVSYTRGRDLSGFLQGAGGIGGLLARTDNQLLAAADPSANAYYHADGGGNITTLISTNQLIVARYHYDPYGNILSQTGPLSEANTYRFSSKEFHPSSGLVYYLYRYYEPSLQRWPNRDPLGEKGGINLYGFVKNNPLSFWDILGLYVDLVYDVANETLTATDVDTKKTLTLKKVKSGNGASCCKKEDQWKKDEGPIPTGKYLVGQGYDSGHGGDDWWYKLYGNNGKGGYSYNDIPVTGPDGTVYHRGGFNLHTGRASDGCVTVWSDVSRGEQGYPKSDDYNKLKEMLDKTKPLEYKGSKYSGWLEVK